MFWSWIIEALWAAGTSFLLSTPTHKNAMQSEEPFLAANISFCVRAVWQGPWCFLEGPFQLSACWKSWQSHWQNTSQWRNMSLFFFVFLQFWSLKRETSTDSRLQKKEDVVPLVTTPLFTPKTCKMISTANMCEFHTLWLTSCKDSLTSYIQQWKQAIRQVHRSICVTWGKKRWLIIGPKRRQERIRACCWLKWWSINVFSTYDFSNNLWLMIPSFCARDCGEMWK